MPDYYPLVAKAVAGLEKNTGEARRALYERARTALVAQLRNMDPPLTESEITRERLALEEAIRKVEAETARRSRSEIGRPGPANAAKPSERAKTDASPDGRDAKPGKPAPPAKAPEMDPLRAMAGEAPRGDQADDPAKSRQPARNRMLGDRPTVTDEGLKGFRDVVAEAESLGEAPAQASKSAREIFAAVPPPSGQNLDKMEPRIEPEGLRTPVRPVAAPRPPQPPEWTIERQQVQPPLLEPHDSPFEARPAPARPAELPDRAAEPRTVLGRPPRQQPIGEIDERPRRSRLGLVAALLAVLLIVGLGASAFWQREKVAALFNSVRGQTTQVPREQTPTQPKTQDRVGQPGQQEAPRPPGAETQTAAVAQRVVLYEEDPSDPQGKRYVGSAIWRTETVTPGPGLAPELAVRADLEIPERRITMTFSLRRNTDQALPASHTIEILFNLPADFPFGGISNVPGILMKQAEATRGAPLAGLAVKVTSGFFLVGLSAAETDVQRNIQLLKERSWFDVPIVYNNGRRAILALEKGNPGERAFNEAFAAWGQ